MGRQVDTLTRRCPWCLLHGERERHSNAPWPQRSWELPTATRRHAYPAETPWEGREVEGLVNAREPQKTSVLRSSGEPSVS